MVSHMRRAAIGVLGMYWLALFVGTHVPISMKGMGQGGDKILHFLAFTGLAFLMSFGIGGRRPTWRAFAVVLVVALSYAGFDEFSQLLVGRHCDFWDWFADCLGTVTGLFAYWVVTVFCQNWLLASRRPKTEIAMR
jgi:VanZ family protein